MRAVENNVPVLRAANTGISALIAPDGRLVQTLGADKTGYLAGIFHTVQVTRFTAHSATVFCFSLPLCYCVRIFIRAFSEKSCKKRCHKNFL